MSTTVRSVKLKLVYSDATTQTITFNDVDSSVLPNVKAKVKAINAYMPPAFAYTFVSKNGAPCTMISQAQLVFTTEEVIYNAS